MRIGGVFRCEKCYTGIAFTRAIGEREAPQGPRHFARSESV